MCGNKRHTNSSERQQPRSVKKHSSTSSSNENHGELQEFLNFPLQEGLISTQLLPSIIAHNWGVSTLPSAALNPFQLQLPRQYGEPQPDLLTLVQSYNWTETLNRICFHPSEASAVGVQGRTPLHIACDHDAPAVVIRSLLIADFKASTMVGTSKMTPLHITCSSQHASTEVVSELLFQGIDGKKATVKQITEMQDVDGDTPLHTACRCGAPIEVLALLLESNPGVVHARDYEGLTPLLRLWVRYFVTLGENVISKVEGKEDLTGDLGEAWQKTVLLLRVSYYGESLCAKATSAIEKQVQLSSLQQMNYPFPLIHATAAVDCPRPVVNIAAKLNPDLINKTDCKGYTPIALAAKAPIFKEHDLSDNGYCIEDKIHGDDVPALAADIPQQQRQTSVIKILLDASADASHPHTFTGRIPLNLAIVSGKTWFEGVYSLLEAYPEGLMSVDPPTGLYPFMLSATVGVDDNEEDMKVTNTKRMEADITTIFCLLRIRPESLDWAI